MTTEYTVDGLLQALQECNAAGGLSAEIADEVLHRARELSVNAPSNSASIASSNGVTDEDARKALVLATGHYHSLMLMPDDGFSPLKEAEWFRDVLMPAIDAALSSIAKESK